MTSRFFRNNGLSIVLLLIFLTFLSCEFVVGHRAFNNDRLDHSERAISLREYASTGNFMEATAENWESEFLEMAGFCWLTSFLFQKGSPESRDPDAPAEEKAPVTKTSPWPARRGGIALAIYARSLSIGFLFLFLIAFSIHALGGKCAYNDNQLLHGQPTVSVVQFLGTSEFWFQSFQNWQSEFLGILLFVVLSIFLRERGSPESKPVPTPHSQNE